MIWSDPIEVDGVRPAWLGGHCERIAYKCSNDPEWFGPVDDMPDMWSESDITQNPPGWSNVEAIRLPADHFAYLAIAKGFEPYAGTGEPLDWDGTDDVILRNGNTGDDVCVTNWNWDNAGYDIIGYKRKQATDGSDYASVKRMTKSEFHGQLIALGMNVEEWLAHSGIILPPTQAETIAIKTGLTVDQVQSVLNEVSNGTR